jgi:hypothetical protein
MIHHKSCQGANCSTLGAKMEPMESGDLLPPRRRGNCCQPSTSGPDSGSLACFVHLTYRASSHSATISFSLTDIRHSFGVETLVSFQSLISLLYPQATSIPFQGSVRLIQQSASHHQIVPTLATLSQPFQTCFRYPQSTVANMASIKRIQKVPNNFPGVPFALQRSLCG